MNPFSSFRIINAEDIILANIRPNFILDDVRGLINALQPVLIIANRTFNEKETLHANVIEKLTQKPCTLDLLEYFGYRKNDKGDYEYRSAKSNDEMRIRQESTNEFNSFFEDLKRMKKNSFDGFKEYLLNASSRPTSRLDDDDDYEEFPSRPQSSMSFRLPPLPSPTPLPSFSQVNGYNEQTRRMLRSFKESIIPAHGGRPPPSFIRRQLAILLFKQIHPDSIGFGDENIDNEIDQMIRRLRQNDRSQDIVDGNEVYYECLIRAIFDLNIAHEILLHRRPNLKPPPELTMPQRPTTTTLASSTECLQRHCMAINESMAENGAIQMLLHTGDEWKNATHLVTAIIALRQQYKTTEVNDLILSKMYRLVFSELFTIVRDLSVLKTEMLAYALCKVSVDSLEHLSVIDIRDILNSCSNTQISENFQDNAVRLLSQECPICNGSFPRSQMETMFLCNHMCCFTCLKNYYRNTIKQIKDSETLKRLSCFEEAHEISADVTLNFFLYLESKLKKWFVDERLVLDTYHENLFIATRDSQIKKCGNPKCIEFFGLNNDNRIARARCPHCQFQQCQLCCRKWFNDHTGMSCEEYTNWLRENDPDDPEVQLMKYLSTAGMACPNEQCKAIYEYAPGGCEHFTCRQCTTQFCRICSELFYDPKRNILCPRAGCPLRATLHAHCRLNCFREIRDADEDQIIELLTTHNINVMEELRQKPIANDSKCSVEGCKKAPSMTSENRFCEGCYKQFLCLFVWRNQIEPWELYEDNNLRQKLMNVGVNIPADTTKDDLIELAKQHLTQYLGVPKKIERIRQ